MDFKEKFTEKSYNELSNIIDYFNSTYNRFNLDDIERNVKSIILYNGIVVFRKTKSAEYQDGNTSQNTLFSRVRIVNDTKIESFKDINQFMTLPSNKITWEGRLNTKGEALLYASHNSFLVPIFETSVKLGDKILYIVYRRKQGEIIRLRKMAIDEDQIIKLDNYAAKINDLKLNFVKYWLTKHSDGKNDDYLYRITNTIKSVYASRKSNDSIDGYIYPSTTKRKNDLNVAFNTHGSKKIYIYKVFYGEVVKMDSNLFFLKLKHDFKGINNGEIIWEVKQKFEITGFKNNY